MNSHEHHRRSIRLQDYDYAQNGAYFVTICTQDRANWFGEIAEGETVLNSAGKMIERWWYELERKFPEIDLDAFVIMPNHVHGVIVIVGADLRVCPDPANQLDQGAHIGAPLQSESSNPSLSQIVQWFKTMTTNDYIRGVKDHAWQPFQGRLWQRNYYEQVIRHEPMLNEIREYIVFNPGRWAEDRENLANVSRN